MFRKIIIGILLTGLVGILVFGAVNRTLARADAGSGQGNGRIESTNLETESLELEIEEFFSQTNVGREEGECQGNGNGQGMEQGQGLGMGRNRNQYGEQGNVSGFGIESDQGQGKGNGQGRGNGKGNGNRGSQANQQLDSVEMLTLEGEIESVNENSIVILATNGALVEIEGHARRYAQEQGFIPAVGDPVSFTAFLDSYGVFIVASIENLSNGQNLILREMNGRPMWAGSGS